MAEENLNGLSSDELTGQPDETENVDPGETVPHENSPPEEIAAEESTAEAPLRKKKGGKSPLRIISKTCAALVVTSAIVVLIAYFVFPVVRVYGSSMSPTLVAGDIVIARKTSDLECGDICIFNYGSRILCKRIIGVEGDVIEINDEGLVYVNGNKIDEPYAKGSSLGNNDTEFPLTVPEDSYFVLGDNRRNSIDSRSSVVGCVSREQIVGKLLFCVWPIPSFGKIE